MTKAKVAGISSAGMVALFQGLEGVIFTLFGLVFSVAAVFTTTSFSTATIFLRETLVVVAITLIFWQDIKSSIKRCLKKEGISLLISGFFVAIGNFFYVLSFTFAGPSFGPVLTTLYPIFSLILFRFMFKDKQNIKVWASTALAIISGLLFILLPSILSNHGFNLKRFLGMILGMLAAIFWAAEGMFIKKSFDISKKNPMNHKEVILVRSYASWITSIVFVIPLGFIPDAGHTHSPFTMMQKILIDYRSTLIVIAIGVGTLLLKYFHAHAIKKIGPKLTAIVDTNNFIVPAFIALFISLGDVRNAVDGTILYETFQWWVWLLVIPLIVGVYLVLHFENSDEENRVIVFDRNLE